MDILSISPTFTISIASSILRPAQRIQIHYLPINLTLPNSSIRTTCFNLSLSSPPPPSSFSSCNCFSSRTAATSTTTYTSFASSTTENRHWIVIMEKPPQGVNSKQSEKEAQMCIYNASWDTHFGFCCDIDEETSSQLARLPGVISVKNDPYFNYLENNYRSPNEQEDNLSKPDTGATLLFPAGTSKHWLVRMDKLGIRVVTKAQVVDYYAQILTKVMANEKDAQMCIYHVSWKANFGFSCELDEDCAQELGSNLDNSLNVLNSSEASQTTPIKTKKLFVTGLSFHTSEKTLRSAFEGFGELVEDLRAKCNSCLFQRRLGWEEVPKR